MQINISELFEHELQSVVAARVFIETGKVKAVTIERLGIPGKLLKSVLHQAKYVLLIELSNLVLNILKYS